MKKLYRSRSDRKIAGIFGGIGEAYNMDPNVLRLLGVLLFFISGFFPVLITYIVAWVIVPDAGDRASDISRDAASNAGESGVKGS